MAKPYQRYSGEELLAKFVTLLPLVSQQVSGHLRGIIATQDDGVEVLDKADIIRRDLDRVQARWNKLRSELGPLLETAKLRALNRAQREFLEEMAAEKTSAEIADTETVDK